MVHFGHLLAGELGADQGEAVVVDEIVWATQWWDFEGLEEGRG